MEDFRKFLLKELTVQLRDHGFVFTEPDMDGIASFDLAAKRDDDKFIIKIVYNIDTIIKPKASRQSSSEIYILFKGFRP